MLTTDHQVAGVVSAGSVQGTAVGVAEVSGDEATVTILQGGLEVKGKVSSTAERYDGQLVTVTSSSAGRLNLTPVSGSSARSSLNVSTRMLGERAVAENVVIYDQVGSKTVLVQYDDLTMETIPQSKISFVSYDYAGRVRYMVLDDVTGDAYTYGYLGCETVEKKFIDLDGKEASYNQLEVWVRQGEVSGENVNEVENSRGTVLAAVRNNVPGGVVCVSEVRGDKEVSRVIATVTLESITKVGRSAFDSEEMTVTVAGEVYPISEEVQCYNKSTKSWFAPGKDGMEAARAYSDELTLYYDRTPAEGGKIRMIVVP